MKQQHTLFIPEQKTPHFHHSGITITWKPKLSHELLQDDLERFKDLYELGQNSPKKVLKDVLRLRERYPSSPEILNLLTHLYVRLRKVRKAEKLIADTYQKNSCHLLSRINYADQCMRKKKLDQIPKIFNNCYDLQKLYPKTEAFNITEFRGFMLCMGNYHFLKKEKDKAICYHYLAHELEPSHPSVRSLTKKLYRQSLIKRLLDCTFLKHKV